MTLVHTFRFILPVTLVLAASACSESNSANIEGMNAETLRVSTPVPLRNNDGSLTFADGRLLVRDTIGNSLVLNADNGDADSVEITLTHGSTSDVLTAFWADLLVN